VSHHCCYTFLTSPPSTFPAHNNAVIKSQAVLPTEESSNITSPESFVSSSTKCCIVRFMSLAMHHGIQLCIIEQIVEEIMNITPKYNHSSSSPSLSAMLKYLSSYTLQCTALLSTYQHQSSGEDKMPTCYLLSLFDAITRSQSLTLCFLRYFFVKYLRYLCRAQSLLQLARVIETAKQT